MKKVLSLVLALLMTASSASAVLADEAIADVEETAVVEEVAEAGQYDKAISFLANYGIFKGISADDLGADLDVNRYQMALFVGRISTGWVDDSKWEDGPENWSEFTDISEGAVADYWGALSYANQKGIIEGYGNGKFGPYDGITYQNALTMVVRTLGYTGLDWPWGYIQKAVELGLTDGITDVAYTEELTRGETAQIIYNAMFAKTKGGSTLALDNFGIAFGWEKVIITASDLNTFTTDSAKAALTLKSDNVTRYYKDSNKPAAGLVNFQILNDDGTLADDVYTVNAASLGLVDEHDDELAVGDAYYILFEQNKDEEFVEVVAYEPLYVETLVNAGKTDDEGEEADYEINEWIDAHSLVSKYSSNAYINMTKPAKDEAIVFVADNSTIEVVTGSEYAIAIDWATGDILVPVDSDKDGDWKDEWKAAKDASKNKTEKEIAATLTYELKYSWNNTLKKYYEVVFDRDIDKFEDVAINWISEAEMEKLLKDYTYEDKTAVKGFNKAVDGITKSAYAALKLFDTNLDGAADRGIYETYRLGYFENKAVKTCDCGKLDQYVISDVNTITQALAAYKAKEGKDATDIAAPSITVREEGIVCKHDAARAWIVDDSALVAAVDEDGEETGYYAPAYVLYNYDAETGALKIVKNITDGADEDSFVTTGIVRAYNITKGTVVIGEETYKINNYAELLGNGFRYATDNTAAKAVYGALLESLFNQFVTYVVVDGELVHIQVLGQNKYDAIIVDSYAGLSSDGYIVVNGYLASELKYSQFKIGSYDGWMKGDYYYYLDKETAEESFTKGTIYAIASKDGDIYNVTLSGKWDGNVYEVENGVKLYATTITEGTDGYMNVTIDGTTSEIKMKSTDKYIIIPKTVNTQPYTTVIVYEGKLQNGWEVKGDRINSNDAGNRTYIIVNADVTGFPYSDAYETSLVLYLDGQINSADYNGNFAEDSYLLGAVEYEATVFDVITGKEVSKFFTNKKLESGNLYYTMGDVITEDTGAREVNIDDVMHELANLYPEYKLSLASYLIGNFTINEKTAAKFFAQSDVDGDGDKDADDAELWVGTTPKMYSYQILNATGTQGEFVEGGLAKVRKDEAYHKGIIGDIKYFIVDYVGDKYDEIESIKELSYDKFQKLVKDYASYTYDVYYVYTIDGNMICYLSNEAQYKETTVVTKDTTSTNVVKVADLTNGVQNTEAYVGMTFDYATETTTYTDGTTSVDYILKTITLQIAGKSVEDATHAEIVDNGWYFGEEGFCTKEDLQAIIDVTVGNKEIDVETIYSSIVEGVYAEHDDEDCKCNLVNKLVIEVTPVTAKNSDGKVDGFLYEADDIVINDEIVDNGPDISVTVTLVDGTDDDDCLLSGDGTTLATATLGYFVSGNINGKFDNGFTSEYEPTTRVFAYID